MGESGTINRRRLLIRLRPFMYGGMGHLARRRGPVRPVSQCLSNRRLCAATNAVVSGDRDASHYSGSGSRAACRGVALTS